MLTRSVLSWRGHRICVSETGEGEPLLLVPGLGCSADVWMPFIEQIEARRMVSFDAPGAGRSSTPSLPVSVGALAALAVAVLDDRGIDCTDVVGFSYGGAIAQQLAHDYPARVARLVLAATTCGVGAMPGTLAAMAALATPLRFYSPRYFERTAGALYGGAIARDPEVRSRLMGPRFSHPPTPYGYAMQLLGGAPWSSWPFLADIPHETLVMVGDDDPLVPVANAQFLAGLIPRARLEVVPRAGHLFLWDDAERTAPRIAAFVAPRSGG
jgi:poly(3-hydroxyoctanoate) depolymerase